MQYWINHNGVQSGPVEPEALKQMGLTSEAYVWHEGMTDWVKITQVPELQGMYDMASQPVTEPMATPQHVTTGQPVTTRQPITPQQYNEPQYGPVQSAEACPPTNMVWAVLATVLCCIPLGIVGIIYANKVSKLYLAGDIEGAKKASETGAWWVIAAITIGIIWRPLLILSSGA